MIGAGYWGKNIVRNFAALNALAAVVDQDRSTAQALCAQHGWQRASFEEVLTDASHCRRCDRDARRPALQDR